MSKKKEMFEEMIQFISNYNPSDIEGIGAWPFHLSLAQLGELDTEFIQKFKIEILDSAFTA